MISARSITLALLLVFGSIPLAAAQQIILGRGFDGPTPAASCQDASFYPRPDPTIAVGPTHIVATVNSYVDIWRRNPWSSTSVQIPLSTLFGGCPTGADYVDPRCLYDHYPSGSPWWGQRFVVMAIVVNTSTIHLAVSNTSDPTGAWDVYSYAQTAWNGIDHSGLGYDAMRYYTTTDKLNSTTQSFIHTFKKWDPSNPILVEGHQNFTDAVMISPAIAWDGNYASGPSAETPYGYLLDTKYGSPFGSYLRVYSWDNGSNWFDSRLDLTTRWQSPGTSNIPECSGNLVDLGFDAIVGSCVWSSDTLYGTHSVKTDSSDRQARWYDVQLNGWPGSGQQPYLSGAETFESSTQTFMPALAIDPGGTLGMVIGTVSKGISPGPPGVGVAGAVAATPPSWSPVVNVKTGLCVPGDQGWGDYFGIAVDPYQSPYTPTFWVIGEYWRTQGGNEVWGTWIQEFHYE